MAQSEYNVAEAKRRLSELLGRVAFAGERILITRRGRPMAHLVPVAPAEPLHLADVDGWLEDDDPFFERLAGVIDGRAIDTGRGIPDLDR